MPPVDALSSDFAVSPLSGFTMMARHSGTKSYITDYGGYSTSLSYEGRPVSHLSSQNSRAAMACFVDDGNKVVHVVSALRELIFCRRRRF